MSPLKIQQGSSKHSAYDLRDPYSQVIETHTLAVIVDNAPGEVGPATASPQATVTSGCVGS